MAKLVIVPMPTVLSMLVRREADAGRALTEAEVIAVRDGAQSVAMPADVAQEVARKRGYDELDLDNVWEAWLAFKRAYPDVLKLE